jgi:hypothetical protein
MKLNPDAAEALRFFDEHDQPLADAMDTALDKLEADHTSADVRRHRTDAANRYIIDVRVPGRDDDYWVVWELVGGEPVVWHIGRARL